VAHAGLGNCAGITRFPGECLGHLRWRSQRLTDIKVTAAGDAAVLTAAVTDEVSQDGQDRAFRLRLTQMWVRTPEGWRCIAGHASRALP
jgi:ketosteroid isomerase-like protein